jgi:hypothetical protein
MFEKICVKAVCATDAFRWDTGNPVAWLDWRKPTPLLPVTVTPGVFKMHTCNKQKGLIAAT